MNSEQTSIQSHASFVRLDRNMSSLRKTCHRSNWRAPSVDDSSSYIASVYAGTNAPHHDPSTASTQSLDRRPSNDAMMVEHSPHQHVAHQNMPKFGAASTMKAHTTLHRTSVSSLTNHVNTCAETATTPSLSSSSSPVTSSVQSQSYHHHHTVHHPTWPCHDTTQLKNSDSLRSSASDLEVLAFVASSSL